MNSILEKLQTNRDPIMMLLFAWYIFAPPAGIDNTMFLDKIASNTSVSTKDFVVYQVKDSLEKQIIKDELKKQGEDIKETKENVKETRKTIDEIKELVKELKKK